MSAWRGSLGRGRWGLVVLVLVGLLMVVTVGGASGGVQGLLPGASSNSEQAQATWTWDFTWAWPGAQAAEEANALADAIEAVTGGKLALVRHAPGSAVPGYTELQGITDGDLDIAQSWMGAYTDQLGLGALFAGEATGVLGTLGAATWGSYPENQALISTLLDGTGALFMSSPLEIPAGWGFCRSGVVIQQPEDFQGLKYRASGVFADIFTELGATPLDVAQADLSSALSAGTVDCVDTGLGYRDWEWRSQWGTQFQAAAPEWHFPNLIHQGSPALATLVRAESWDQLPRDLQVGVESAIKGRAVLTSQDRWHEGVERWDAMVRIGLVNVRWLPPETQQWIRDTIIRYFDRAVVGDPMATALWESQKDIDAGAFEFVDLTVFKP